MRTQSLSPTGWLRLLRYSANRHISQNKQQLAVQHVAHTALQNVVGSFRELTTLAVSTSDTQPRTRTAPAVEELIETVKMFSGLQKKRLVSQETKSMKPRHAAALKCGWSEPCEQMATPRSIKLDEHKIDLPLCDYHWMRVQIGDFNCAWFGEVIARLVHSS